MVLERSYVQPQISPLSASHLHVTSLSPSLFQLMWPLALRPFLQFMTVYTLRCCGRLSILGSSSTSQEPLDLHVQVTSLHCYAVLWLTRKLMRTGWPSVIGVAKYCNHPNVTASVITYHQLLGLAFQASMRFLISSPRVEQWFHSCQRLIA